MKKSKGTLLQEILGNIWALEYLVNMKYNGFEVFFPKKCFLKCLENTSDFLRNLTKYQLESVKKEKSVKFIHVTILLLQIKNITVDKKRNTFSSMLTRLVEILF